MGNRRVWLALLPQMRIAFIQRRVAGTGDEEAYNAATADAWNAFNAWRTATRPPLGRPDIAAITWTLPAGTGDGLLVRAGLPVRSDYRPQAPVRSIFLAGGAFAYACADDADEVDDAFLAVSEWMASHGYHASGGGLVLHRFHFNLDQRPADCGFLVEGEDGRPVHLPGSGHTSPLPIAQATTP